MFVHFSVEEDSMNGTKRWPELYLKLSTTFLRSVITPRFCTHTYLLHSYKVFGGALVIPYKNCTLLITDV